MVSTTGSGRLGAQVLNPRGNLCHRWARFFERLRIFLEPASKSLVHRTHKTMARLFLLALLALLLTAPAPLWAAVDDQIRDQEQDLEVLRQELAAKRAEKDQLAGREKNILGEIKNLEERVQLAEKLLRSLKGKKESCQRDIASLRTDLQAAEKRTSARRKVLADRARQLYIHGRLGELEALFSAQSLPDLADRVQHYRLMADQDRRLLEGALADQMRISADKAALEKQLAETRRLEEEQRREEQRLSREKVDRGKLLKEVRDKKTAYDQAIREMEESARQIQAIIDQLEKQRHSAQPAIPLPAEFEQQAGRFDQLKGTLPWPVQGKVIRKFGKQVHPKYKTVTLSKGIDIQASIGTEIRAVAAGKVIYSSWLRGYGQFIILSHTKGYYTLYAHTSELLVADGDLVRAGQVIGRVGETGSLEGPKLHFEVRHGKEQLDPLTWLK